MKDGANPANGSYDLRFALYDAVSGGLQMGPTVFADEKAVAKGLFTVELDFGSSAFSSGDRWMEIGVRPGSAPNDLRTDYTALSPRQKVTAAPLAIYAANAANAANAASANSANALQGRTVSSAPPANGQVLKWDGASWAPGADNQGSSTPLVPLMLNGSESGSIVSAVNASSANESAAIKGECPQESGQTAAIEGVNASSSGMGVRGQVTSSSGETYGVRGISYSSSSSSAGVLGEMKSENGSGVRGVNSSGGNGGYGVWGLSNTSQGAGVYGTDDASGAAGVWGNSSSGVGVKGESVNNHGVTGSTWSSNYELSGVRGYSYSSGQTYGVYGTSASSSTNAAGVRGAATETSGQTYGVHGSCASSSYQASGVRGAATASTGENYGVYGTSASADSNACGVRGVISNGAGVGVWGKNNSGGTVGYGVVGESNNDEGAGVYGVGSANNTKGVWGYNNSGIGVEGQSSSNFGVNGVSYGTAENMSGVRGLSYAASGQANGVLGQSSSSHPLASGVRGVTYGENACGVTGEANNGAAATGVYGVSTTGYAGIFEGKTRILGDLTVEGSLWKSSGAFKIDHPLDPANKYLMHSFVESPDMKNIYDGVATLDPNGEASVALPEWFEALNKDFRYQLTAVGAPGPGLYVAQKVKSGQFKIAGGTAGLEVSWQVTGIRKDAYANANRIPVEQEKPAKERGLYIHPEVFGKPASQAMSLRRATTQPAAAAPAASAKP